MPPAKKNAKKQPAAPDPWSLPLLPVQVWAENAFNRATLAQILDNPVFIQAVRYVQDLNRVTVADLVGKDSAKLDTEIQRKAAIHAGAVELVNDLKRLLIRPNSVNAQPEAWGHIQPATQP